MTANANNQRVDATVVAMSVAASIYVWTIVTPAGSGIGPFEPLVASLTTMAPAEVMAIRGKRIRIHTVRPGDTIDTLSRQMAYPDFQRDRFVTLNGITTNEPLRPGMLVKLVVTG